MQGAVCCYTKALKLTDNQADSAVLYRNRSACYLKLEEYSKAEADASKGQTVPSDECNSEGYMGNAPFSSSSRILTSLKTADFV